MNNRWAGNWPLTVLSVVIIAGVACGGAGDGPSRRSARVRCDVHQSTCEARLGERRITLTINPKPVEAMKDLTFEVTISGSRLVRAPHIDLNMEAMDMGPNRVELEQGKSGTWTGTGVIVRCPSGKRAWIASVNVPTAGIAEFIFDVVY